MAEKIEVVAKIDAGNHAVYGAIKKGQKYTIDPDHFAAELFERPEGFKSRLELQDEQRRAAKEASAAPVVIADEAPAAKPAKKSASSETALDKQEVSA